MSMPRDAASPPPFLLGANLPWVHYGIDFGANAWRPEGGVAQPDERAQLETTFAQLAASGVRYVRWFLFCDGRAGLEFRSGGPQVTIDNRVFADLDAALEMVAAAGLQVAARAVRIPGDAGVAGNLGAGRWRLHVVRRR